MEWKRECRNDSCIAVYKKGGFEIGMPWSKYIKLKKAQKRIKNEVTGFLQIYPKQLAISCTVDWAMAAFGVPPVFRSAVQVFIET